MRRIWIYLLVAVFVLFGLCACADGESVQISETDATGVSSGQYEEPMIYYQGNLYTYKFQGVMNSLADRYVMIGTVEEFNPDSIPSRDFCATGVDLKYGQEIYAETEDSPSVIFVDIGDSYMPMYVVEE